MDRIIYEGFFSQLQRMKLLASLALANLAQGQDYADTNPDERNFNYDSYGNFGDYQLDGFEAAYDLGDYGAADYGASFYDYDPVVSKFCVKLILIENP